MVPQTAEEAEALKAAEKISGSQLLAPSRAREVLDEQRAETYRNSRSRREDARRQQHFMYGADGVRPEALVKLCEEEKAAAEKALQDVWTASSSTASAAKLDNELMMTMKWLDEMMRLDVHYVWLD